MHSIEWAAGLFEGEGSMNEKRHALEMQMTDKDTMEEFVKVVGYGNLRYQEPVAGNRKALYRWCVQKPAEVRRILSAMLPYLMNRRAYKALNILDDLELA